MAKAEYYANRLNELISEVNKLRNEIFNNNLSHNSIDTDMLIARGIGSLQRAIVSMERSEFKD